MYCAKCHSDVVNCTCDDIDQRLQELANEPAGLVSYVAIQDIEARRKVLLKEGVSREDRPGNKKGH